MPMHILTYLRSLIPKPSSPSVKPVQLTVLLPMQSQRHRFVPSLPLFVSTTVKWGVHAHLASFTIGIVWLATGVGYLAQRVLVDKFSLAAERFVQWHSVWFGNAIVSYVVSLPKIVTCNDLLLLVYKIIYIWYNEFIWFTFGHSNRMFPIFFKNHIKEHLIESYQQQQNNNNTNGWLWSQPIYIRQTHRQSIRE